MFPLSVTFQTSNVDSTIFSFNNTSTNDTADCCLGTIEKLLSFNIWLRLMWNERHEMCLWTEAFAVCNRPNTTDGKAPRGMKEDVGVEWMLTCYIIWNEQENFLCESMRMLYNGYTKAFCFRNVRLCFSLVLNLSINPFGIDERGFSSVGKHMLWILCFSFGLNLLPVCDTYTIQNPIVSVCLPNRFYILSDTCNIHIVWMEIATGSVNRGCNLDDKKFNVVSFIACIMACLNSRSLPLMKWWSWKIASGAWFGTFVYWLKNTGCIESTS